MYRIMVLLLAMTAVGTPAAAQVAGDPDHEWCDDVDRDGRYERYCEVREFTFSPSGRQLDVNGGPNGGIYVEGWNRNEVRVLARVQTWSRDGDPEDMAREITVETGDDIRAIYPDRDRNRRRRREGSAVSFRVFVPNNSDMNLRTTNGGISLTDVTGNVEFRTTNGGVSLAGVGGDIRGRTTNGGVNVQLEGDQWDGRGLDVETTNGGVRLTLPEGFRAELTTGTVNGGFEIDFPVTVQGRINRRRITTQLNGGGPPIRAVTTNGGVRVLRND